MIDFSQNPAHLRWAEQVLGVSFDSTPAVWLTALGKGGNILGVWVFSRHTTAGCEVTVVGCTKELILAATTYAFHQCDYRRVTAFIAVDNERSLSLAQRLGFQTEGILRDWFPHSDAVILGLLRNDLPKQGPIWTALSHLRPPIPL